MRGADARAGDPGGHGMTVSTDAMLTLSRSIVEQMIAHAREAFPNECCGILGGDGELGTHIYRVANVDPNPRLAYLMSVEEQFWVFRNLRHNGLRFLSVYHSHPSTAPYPSATDIALAHYGDVYYPIVSLANPDAPAVRVYRLAHRRIEPTELRVVDRPTERLKGA
jgi:proteasome lid subunit RPN8/RPN11